MNTTARTVYAAPAAARIGALALALTVTLGLLSAVGQQADHTFDQALVAQAGQATLAQAAHATTQADHRG